MQQDRLKKLQAFLAALPERYVGPMTEAVETDRLAGGELPHGAMLDALRPGLRKTGAKRAGLPSPSRIVFEPLEDFFVNAPPAAKRAGTIARASLAPIWAWMERDLKSDDIRNLVKPLKAAIAGRDAEARALAAKPLRSAVAAALSEGLAGAAPRSPRYEALVARLGSAHAVEDAREVAMLLAAAPVFVDVRALIPACSKRLSEADLVKLRELYDEVSPRLPDQSVYIPVIAMRRLARPWQVMDVLRTLGRVDNDTALCNTTLGLAGDLLLDELQDHANFLVSAKLGVTDTGEVLRQLGIFADVSAGMSQAFDIRRVGPWGQRLAKVRKLVSDSMERQVERLPDQVIGAFPVHAVGAYGPKGVHRPDVGRWPEEEKIVRAVNLALFLEGSRWDATKALFSGPHRTAMDRVGRFLISYGDFLINEIKAAPGGSEEAQRCQAHLESLLRITELVLGSQEADLLRRRATNAAGTAAA